MAGRVGEVRVGTAGWSYADWNGPIYGTGRGLTGLTLLARHLGAVEVNVTYYRVPAPDLARGWLLKVAAMPGFLFTVKLWRGFTHERDFRPSDVTQFRDGVAPLVEAGRFGALLIQFPWSFRCERASRAYLRRLVRSFSDLPRVVELRHRGWDREDVRAELREEDVGFCNIDQPALRDCLGPTAHVTSGVAYVRLHGRNEESWFREDAGRDERYNYRYAEEELVPWVDRIRRLQAQARRVFVVTNNHLAGAAVVNAIQLQHLLDGRRRELPGRWLDAFPVLARIGSAELERQRPLFGEPEPAP